MRTIITAALAVAIAPLARAQDTQTLIAQSNVIVSSPTSDWIAQRAAGNLIGFSASNLASTRQVGNNNSATTDQTGSGNTALLSQTGNNNLANLTQNSDSGLINATQAGNNIGITITQTGHAPAITVTQTHPGR